MGGVFSSRSTSSGESGVPVVLNVYDLTPLNNYMYWFGLGIFHSGIEGESFRPHGRFSLFVFFYFPNFWSSRVLFGGSAKWFLGLVFYWVEVLLIGVFGVFL